MRAAIYTYTAAPNDLNRDRQKAACDDAAASAGYEVSAWLHDEAGDRSGLDLLGSHLYDDCFDAIVIHDQYRFGRSTNAFLEVIEVVKAAGVRLVYCNDPTPPIFDSALRSQITANRTFVASNR